MPIMTAAASSLNPPLAGGSKTPLRFRGGVSFGKAEASCAPPTNRRLTTSQATPPQDRAAVLTLPQGEGSRRSISRDQSRTGAPA